MTETVYVLGAGFDVSVLDDIERRNAPLASDFFKVLFGSGQWQESGVRLRDDLQVDRLLREIQRYWKVTEVNLAEESFDVEECLTLFESIVADGPDPSRASSLKEASLTLRRLLLVKLAEVPTPTSPYSRIGTFFGCEVLRDYSDVITFNYDIVAERCIEGASGSGRQGGVRRNLQDDFCLDRHKATAEDRV